MGRHTILSLLWLALTTFAMVMVETERVLPPVAITSKPIYVLDRSSPTDRAPAPKRESEALDTFRMALKDTVADPAMRERILRFLNSLPKSNDSHVKSHKLLKMLDVKVERHISKKGSNRRFLMEPRNGIVSAAGSIIGIEPAAGKSNCDAWCKAEAGDQHCADLEAYRDRQLRMGHRGLFKWWPKPPRCPILPRAGCADPPVCSGKCRLQTILGEPDPSPLPRPPPVTPAKPTIPSSPKPNVSSPKPNGVSSPKPNDLKPSPKPNGKPSSSTRSPSTPTTSKLPLNPKPPADSLPPTKPSDLIITTTTNRPPSSSTTNKKSKKGGGDKDKNKDKDEEEDKDKDKDEDEDKDIDKDIDIDMDIERNKDNNKVGKPLKPSKPSKAPSDKLNPTQNSKFTQKPSAKTGDKTGEDKDKGASRACFDTSMKRIPCPEKTPEGKSPGKRKCFKMKNVKMVPIECPIRTKPIVERPVTSYVHHDLTEYMYSDDTKTYKGVNYFDDAVNSRVNGSISKTFNDMLKALPMEKFNKEMAEEMIDLLKYFNDKPPPSSKKQGQDSSQSLPDIASGVKALLGHLFTGKSAHDCKCDPDEACKRELMNRHSLRFGHFKRRCQGSCPNNPGCPIYQCVFGRMFMRMATTNVTPAGSQQKLSDEFDEGYDLAQD